MNKTKQADLTKVMVFNNPEFGKIRIVFDENEEPLFCGKDLCDVLGYKRTDLAVRQHVNPSDAVKRCIRCESTRNNKPVFQIRTILFVRESGLYALIFGSKLDTAQKFKHWVTSVVLPQIRKTGGYIPVHDGDTQEDIIRRAEEILRRTIAEKDEFIGKQQALLDKSSRLIAEQEAEIDRLLPKALYADNVLESVSCFTTTQIAKELGMTAQELNRELCAKHIQYYQSGQYLLYAQYAHKGYARSRTHYELVVGKDMITTRMYLVWTEAGRRFIHSQVESKC